MKKSSVKPMVLITLILSLFVILVSSALAWYSSVEAHKPNIEGSVLSGYFAGGDGTKADPYIINAPIHIYNLAWLQYMGEFNKDKDNDGVIEQFYFKIADTLPGGGDTIDMGGLVIPPIGTSQHPFVGNFNGNQKCIKNMTVSNYLSVEGVDSEGAIVQRPLTVTDIDKGFKVETTGNTDIVGFFGVVGNFAEALGDKTIADDKGKTDVTSQTTPNDSSDDVVNSVYDLFLDGVSVRTESDNSLIGLFAGYVNGTAENVGVGEGEIYIGAGTSPLTDAQIAGMQQTVSAYSLVGAINADNVDWSELPTGSDIIPGGPDGSFGGSINMDWLAKRITYMYTENIRSLAEGKTAPYKLSVGPNSRGDNYQFNFDANANVAYLNSDSILPLNVDTEQMLDNATADTVTVYFSNNASVTPYYTTDSSSGYTKTLTYKTNSWYKNQEPEIISSSNTGYIVGGGASDLINSGSIRVRVNSIGNTGIYKSVGTATNSNAIITRENLELLTLGINENGNAETYKIKDFTYNAESEEYEAVSKSGSVVGNSAYTSKDSTDFKRYDSVISNFVKSAGTSKLISGIRFYGLYAGLELGADGKFSSDTQNITAWLVDDATGKLAKHENYEVVNSAINFHLSAPGYITAIAGTYLNPSDDHYMFQLYKVIRENNQITSAEKIDTIWVVYETGDNGQETLKFIEYNRKSATVNSAGETDGRTCELAYDSSLMGTLTEGNAAYYFELPVLGGDYVMGLPNGSDDGPYLMYLDIGANGDISLGEGGGSVASKEHTMKGINFVDDAGIAAKDASVASYPMVTFEINRGSGSGAATASFNRTGKDTMTYSFTSSSAFTVTPFVNNNTPTVTTPVSTLRASPAGGALTLESSLIKKRRRLSA